MEEKRPSPPPIPPYFSSGRYNGRGPSTGADETVLFSKNCSMVLAVIFYRSQVQGKKLQFTWVVPRQSIVETSSNSRARGTSRVNWIPNIVDRAHLSSDSLGDDLVIWIKFSPCRDCFFNVTVPFAIYPPPPSPPPLPAPPPFVFCLFYNRWMGCMCKVLCGNSRLLGTDERKRTDERCMRDERCETCGFSPYLALSP